MTSSDLHSDLIRRESDVILQTYRRHAIVIDRAEGCRVYDVDGTAYLDMLGGIAVNTLGHSNPKIINAVTQQMQRYMHVSNMFYQEPQVALAEQLKAATGYDRVFFSNSGTEANEGAMKLARKHGSAQGRYDIIGFTGGFHGRTYGVLSIMDKPLYKDGMGPFLPNTMVLPYNDIDALTSRVDESTCAVVLEFIQGEGGLSEATQEFVDAVWSLKNQYNFLIIADEVQTGFGRTGPFFSYERYGVKPDVVTIAKALGGGLPLGGFLTTNEVAPLFERGMHGTTYGGNAVACAAGSVVVEEVVGGLMKHAAEVGEYAQQRLNELVKDFPAIIREVRGRGLMFGLALHSPAQPYTDALVTERVISNTAGGNVMRFLPPLIIGKSEIDELVEALRAVFSRQA